MTLLDIPDTWLAVIGTTFGAAGLKFVDWYLGREKVEEDSATAFRKELREEVAALRAELGRVSKEVDQWREKYYEVLEELIASKQKMLEEGIYPVEEVQEVKKTRKRVSKNTE